MPNEEPTVGAARGRIGKQIVLPWSKAVEISFKGMQTRFWRSLITMSSVVLAIAFLMSIWTSAAIVNDLSNVPRRQAQEAEAAVRRAASFLTAGSLTPEDAEELRRLTTVARQWTEQEVSRLGGRVASIQRVPEAKRSAAQASQLAAAQGALEKARHRLEVLSRASATGQASPSADLAQATREALEARMERKRGRYEEIRQILFREGIDIEQEQADQPQNTLNALSAERKSVRENADRLAKVVVSVEEAPPESRGADQQARLVAARLQLSHAQARLQMLDRIAERMSSAEARLPLLLAQIDGIPRLQARVDELEKQRNAPEWTAAREQELTQARADLQQARAGLEAFSAAPAELADARAKVAILRKEEQSLSPDQREQLASVSTKLQQALLWLEAVTAKSAAREAVETQLNELLGSTGGTGRANARAALRQAFLLWAVWDGVASEVKAGSEGTSDPAEEQLRLDELKTVLSTLKSAPTTTASVFGFLTNMKAKDLWLVMLALLVCFVGIVNAMLMSVSERFREIGTMKCLGALDSFIVKLFLLESSFQGAAGTVMGIVIGFVLSLLRATFAYGRYTYTYFPARDILLSAAMSVAVGVILCVLAAVYPAGTAARMEPVEAMRVEE